MLDAWRPPFPEVSLNATKRYQNVGVHLPASLRTRSSVCFQMRRKRKRVKTLPSTAEEAKRGGSELQEGKDGWRITEKIGHAKKTLARPVVSLFILCEDLRFDKRANVPAGFSDL